MQSADASKTRALLGLRFKLMCADAGLSIEDAASFLHVTTRTIRYWYSGKTFVPFSAYKLLRIHCRYELPGKGWEGWHMHSGKLWTPEGHGFVPADSTWWGLLVRKARLFDQLYQAQNALHHALNPGAGSAGVARVGDAPASPERAPRRGPVGEAGRAPQAPRPNLLLEHFRKWEQENSLVSLGEPAQALKGQIPHREKPGVGS